MGFWSRNFHRQHPDADTEDTKSQSPILNSVKEHHVPKQHGKVSQALRSLGRSLRRERTPNKFVRIESNLETDTNVNLDNLLDLEVDPISSGGWDLTDLMENYKLEDGNSVYVEQHNANIDLVPASPSQPLATLPFSSITSNACDSSVDSGLSPSAYAHSRQSSSTNTDGSEDQIDANVPGPQLLLDRRETPKNKPLAPVAKEDLRHRDDTATFGELSDDTIRKASQSLDGSDKRTQNGLAVDVDEEDLGSWSESSSSTEEQPEMTELMVNDDSEHAGECQKVPEESKTGDGEDDSETSLNRQDWDTIRNIPDSKFTELLHTAINEFKYEKLTLEDCHVVVRFNGGFNHIVCMMTTKGSYIGRYVVRVPAIGTVARWQEGDAHNMRCEMALMEYLHDSTDIPVPEVITFEDKVDSCIGAPYCVMEQLPGKPAHHIWFEDTTDRNYITANRISAATEAKRCNFLRSLAQTMAQLQNLKFDKIGAPDMRDTFDFDDEMKITHSYRWKSPYGMKAEDLEGEGQIYQYGPFESSKEYMTSTLDDKWPTIPDPDFDYDPESQNIVLGIRKILDIVYAHPTIAFSKTDPTDPDEKETFVLRHPDLDMQNILVDDDGNVTGIIDWEGCLAVPRSVGYASVPDFLRRDWRANYSLDDLPHMLWKFEHYRTVYAEAMLATGAPDAKYTAKSAMYRAVVDAVSEGSPTDLIEKLCKHIPGLRLADVEELEMFVGKGWGEAEEYLKGEMGKLLEPGV